MKQIIVIFLIFIFAIAAFVPLLPAQRVQAQFVVEFGPAATALISTISAATGTTAVATTNTALSTGLVGTGVLSLTVVRESLGNACLSTIVSLDAVDAVQSFLDTGSSAALSLIGGGSFELTKTSAKIAKATAAKLCVDSYVEAVSRGGGTLQVAQEFAREQDKYTKISNSLRETIANLTAQQNASVKDILRAFMVKVILNLNKNLTTELVNKMVDKYKISSYLEYGDALATQVYSMKFINENYPEDVRQQMMIRSIVQSDKFPEQIKTAQAFALSKAQEYTSSVCSAATADYSGQNQNNFLSCVGKLGDPEGSPLFQMMVAEDQAGEVKAQGKAAAEQEISQSNGYAPPRDCSGSLAQQQQIDSQRNANAEEFRIAMQVHGRLKSALSTNRTTPEEVTKAWEDAQAKRVQMNAFPKSIGGAVIDICKAIDSPSSFVSNSIGDFLQQHLDQSADLKSDNLPFYANYLADVASNFLTNILTGGKSTSQV
nr:hypothetical protein [bacterium]